MIYFDGSYTLKGVGAGVVLIPSKGDILKYVIQLEFSTINNIAEYEGLVTGLRLAKDLNIWWLLIRGDSQLVAKQVQKEYDCNNDKMAEYLAEVCRMEKFFDGFEVRYVPRLDYHNVNHLAWIASSRAPTPWDVIIEKLCNPSVRPAEEDINTTKSDLTVIDEPEQGLAYDWMRSIKMFLDNQPPSDDITKVERIAHKFKMYHLIDEILYRRGVNGMMMKYISREEGIQLLQDIHSDICGSHSSLCPIIGKAFRHGFYWLVAKDDVMEVVTKCKDYQFFQKQITKHANPLRPIDLSWPFTIWGIDIVGILARAPGWFRFLFVAIDTFTKWMEAMPVANIMEKVAVKYLQSIIYRFSVPRRVLTDNGTQFKGVKFVRCCVDFDIHH
jgi:ribonuclease HI